MNIYDPFNAFCRHLEVDLEGSGAGSLLGCIFGVKDVGMEGQASAEVKA